MPRVRDKAYRQPGNTIVLSFTCHSAVMNVVKSVPVNPSASPAMRFARTHHRWVKLDGIQAQLGDIYNAIKILNLEDTSAHSNCGRGMGVPIASM